jgi:Zn-dependent protease
MRAMLVEPQTTKADLKWSMLGIPVRVHPFFWIGCVVLGWTGEGTTLPDLILWTACVFVAILIHEFGHALTARAFGARDGRVVLYVMGGLAINTGGLSRGQRVLELLMGPGAGFVAFGVLWVLTQHAFDTSGWPLRAHYALGALELICLWWGLVNLLPVYPLDGGQIARELFEAKRPKDGFVLALRLSMVVALLAGVGFVVLFIRQENSGPAGLYPALLFGYLAFLSWYVARHIQATGHGAGWGGGDLEEPRQPWERDPDWWKG